MVTIETVRGTPEGRVIRTMKLTPDKGLSSLVKASREKIVKEYEEKYKALGKKRIKALKKLKPSPKTKKEIQRGIEKIFMSKKKTFSKSELKAQRAHQIKMAKIRLQQITAQRQSEAEQIAYQQDPRFQPEDPDTQSFLNQEAPEFERDLLSNEAAPTISKNRNNFMRNLLQRVASFNRNRGARPGDLRGLPPKIADRIRRQQNILNTPSVFGSERQLVNVRGGERARITLMNETPPAPQMRASRLNHWRAQ